MADTVRKTAYYYVSVPNQPGEGSRVLDALRDGGVDLLAVHAFPEGGRAQIDVVAKDESVLIEAARRANLELSGPKVAFIADGEDRPGAAAGLLGKLASAGVNVTALDAISTNGRYGALFWVRPEDVERAASALGAS